jgi:hypothetical protein
MNIHPVIAPKITPRSKNKKLSRIRSTTKNKECMDSQALDYKAIIKLHDALCSMLTSHDITKYEKFGLLAHAEPVCSLATDRGAILKYTVFTVAEDQHIVILNSIVSQFGEIQLEKWTQINGVERRPRITEKQIQAFIDKDYPHLTLKDKSESKIKDINKTYYIYDLTSFDDECPENGTPKKVPIDVATTFFSRISPIGVSRRLARWRECKTKYGTSKYMFY